MTGRHPAGSGLTGVMAVLACVMLGPEGVFVYWLWEEKLATGQT